MHSRSHTWSPGAPFLRVNCGELPLTAVPLCQLPPCALGPPCPPLAVYLHIICCSDCTTWTRHMPKPAKPPLSLKTRPKPSSWSLASSSPDPTLATSSGLILQIRLIMALPLRCKGCRFVLVSGQVSLARSMALRTQELYTWFPIIYETFYIYISDESILQADFAFQRKVF